jgi:hypothetical protein
MGDTIMLGKFDLKTVAGCFLSAAGLFAAVVPAHAELASGNFTGKTQITVGVDNDVCRTGAVQCTGAGFVAPASGNRIPVAARIQVLNSAGNPVNGLTDADFAVVTGFVPAGGAAVMKRVCASCFQAVPGNIGVYGLFIEQIPGQNWKSGTYYVQIQVTTTSAAGPFVARGLTEIKIPF